MFPLFCLSEHGTDFLLVPHNVSAQLLYPFPGTHNLFGPGVADLFVNSGARTMFYSKIKRFFIFLFYIVSEQEKYLLLLGIKKLQIRAFYDRYDMR